MSCHALLSPSNHRWVHCPGSIREEKPYPNTWSKAAEDGTNTHMLLELCLIDNRNAGEYIDHPICNGCIIDSARAARVQIALDYIEERKVKLTALFGHDKSITVEAESKSNPGARCGRDDWHGTCDVTITVTDKLNKTLFIEVIDYKDGFQYVEVKNNPQLLAYLYGKCENYGDVIPVQMTIIQPKNTNTPIRYQSLTTWSLQPLVDDLIKAAAATDDPNAPLIRGDHCRWCKHKPNCSEIVNKKIEVISIMDDRGIIKKVHTELETMDNATLSQILDSEKVFIDAFTRAKIEATKRIERDENVPGYFIGKGSSKKVWNEDNEIIEKKLKGMKIIKDVIHPSKFISPAQAVKLELTPTQMKNLEKLISVVEGKPTLKKGEQETVEEMFKDVKETPKKLSFI